MKFWLLTSEYPPMSGGGISTYCYHTAKMMAINDFEVTVFLPNWSLKKKKTTIQEANIKIVEFPIASNEFLGEETAVSYSFSEIVKEVSTEEGEPDYLETQEYNGIGYYVLQRRLLEAGYLEKTFCFVTAHAPSFLYLDYNQTPTHALPAFWIGEMERSSLVSADFVISPSQYLVSEISNYVDLSNQHVEVIPNPYHYSPNTDFSFNRNEILFFGKLIPQKGCLELLHYFKQLWDTGSELTLRLIGGGDHFFHPQQMTMGDFLNKKYNAYIQSGKLIFEGHVDPKELDDQINKAHVILVPSIVDNLPYTVVESMYRGKIVLASENGGHKELIKNSENGFLFSHDQDGTNFSDALNKILNLSDEEIINISKHAHSSIQKVCDYQTVFTKKGDLLKFSSHKHTEFFPFIRPQLSSSSGQVSVENNEKLSVVIPFFNMGDYIEETLQSIVNSNYPEIEILLVNDGSTDQKSLEILDEIEKNYPQLKRYDKPNSGLADTRNYGAEKAEGMYLAFLDADDIIEPDYYTKAIHVLKRYKNVHFVGCWAQYFGRTNYMWPTFNPEPPYLLVHNMINSSALIYKKQSFLEAGLNDITFTYGMEDYDSVLSMVESGKMGVVLPETLWKYRIRKDSMAQSFNNYSKNYLYRLLASKHETFYSRYAQEVVNLLNANGKGMDLNNPTKPLGALHGVNLPFRNSPWLSALKRNKFIRKLAKKFFRHLT